MQLLAYWFGEPDWQNLRLGLQAFVPEQPDKHKRESTEGKLPSILSFYLLTIPDTILVAPELFSVNK